MSAGRFVPTDVLSDGRFVSTDVLSPRTFCTYRRFVHGRFVSGRFVCAPKKLTVKYFLVQHVKFIFLAMSDIFTSYAVPKFPHLCALAT
jgi:hypothetical protein